MRGIRRFILLASILQVGLSVQGQNKAIDPQQLVADIIEELSSKAESEMDFTPIVEDLLNLIENPIDLNQCTLEDLSKLVFLSDFQVQSLYDYCASNAPILSIYELQMVYGLEPGDIQKLTPFVSVVPPVGAKPSGIKRKGRSELIIRSGSVIETPAGYSASAASKYLGDRYSLYTRYSYKSGDKLQVGFLAEKDPGEQLLSRQVKTRVDYLSGYISLSDVGRVKRLLIGDFHAEFGQGLTLWSSFATGKSTEALSVRKRGRGLVKHSSTNENRFLRGVGATIPFGRIDVSVFGSYKKIDASISDTTDSGYPVFTSLPESGYHRTKTELVNRNSVGETLAGGNILFNGKRMRVGATLSHIRIDGEYRSDSALYKSLLPSKSEKTACGVSLEGSLKSHHLFGEAAVDVATREMALVMGGLFRLAPTLQLSVVGRDYSGGYNTLYTSGFAEGGEASNERGVFCGMTILPVKGVKLSGFIDLYSFPWLRYRVNAPSRGSEFYLQSEHTLGKDLSLLMRYRHKTFEQNFSSLFSPLLVPIPSTRQSARLQVSYAPTERVTLRTRFDFTQFDNDSIPGEQGYLLSQDVSYSYPRVPISFAARYAIFNTDSWNSAIYAYESDLLYSFTVPAFYSRGTRTYLMLKYSPRPWIAIWLRWAQTHYANRDEVGQGLDKIVGNTRSDVRMMVRFEF